MEQTLSQGNMRVEDPEQEGGRTLMKWETRVECGLLEYCRKVIKNHTHTHTHREREREREYNMHIYKSRGL
jgi:hypothetical protein